MRWRALPREWQGFMEGAALCGIDAAQRILKGA
jgi:hypothetical protein